MVSPPIKKNTIVESIASIPFWSIRVDKLVTTIFPVIEAGKSRSNYYINMSTDKDRISVAECSVKWWKLVGLKLMLTARDSDISHRECFYIMEKASLKFSFITS